VLAGLLTLSRAHFHTDIVTSVFASGAELSASDLTIRGNPDEPPPSSVVGASMYVSARSSALSRVAVADPGHSGIFVYGPETAAELADIHVTGCRATSLLFRDGATVGAERVLLENGWQVGLHVRDATATVMDLAARRIVNSGGGVSGFGVRVTGGATLDLRRAVVAEASVSGVYVLEPGSVMSGGDIVVDGMLGDSIFGLHGWGIAATNGGRVSVERVELRDARTLGVMANGGDSTVALTDAVIADALPAACADDLCVEAPFGIGIGAYGGAVIDIERFNITRSHVIGVQLAGGGTIDLRSGEVSMTPVGANAQTEGFDITRLQQDVSYTGNGQNLVTDGLPVPSVSGI
jgi:hypothetical protein